MMRFLKIFDYLPELFMMIQPNPSKNSFAGIITSKFSSTCTRIHIFYNEERLALTTYEKEMPDERDPRGLAILINLLRYSPEELLWKWQKIVVVEYGRQYLFLRC